MRKVEIEMENMEYAESFADAADFFEGDETEAALAEPDSEMMLEDSDTETESEGEMESENELVEENIKCVARNVGGYNKDKPPEDDCCPICFDTFILPCRTSCGHWFCSICLLQYWKYSANFKPCKCPICSCLIVKLEPHSSILIQTGDEEVITKVLKDIKLYNRLTIGGLTGLFLKLLAFPLLTRRRLHENWNPMILRCAYNLARIIGLVLGILYDVYDFHFFPSGAFGIQVVFEICGCSIVAFYCLDFIWHRYKLTRRARRRRLALQQMN